MRNKIYLAFLVVLISSFLFSGNLFAADPDLGMYGFLKIGKHKKEVKWNKTIVLTPGDATLISNGKPAFEVYYAYREFAGVAAKKFKNKIFFNGTLVSQQTNLSLNPMQIKHVHTQAYLGPKNGKLQIKIDADNNVKESRENNNFHFYVNIVFRGFKSQSSFRVTRVRAQVNPKEFSGKCPKKFIFKGIILATGKGSVKYQWKRSDGAIAPIKIIKFDRAGTKIVTTSWTLGGAGKVYTKYWEALKILSPNPMMSNKAVFSLKCTGGETPQKKLPDLIVRNIKLLKDCKISITLKNIGNAGVPASYYNLPKAVSVQMYNNDKPWGGLILSGVDPLGKLKSPGGSVSHIWFPNAQNLNLKPGIHKIKVVVDSNSALTESNENNNSLVKTLKCKTVLTIKPGVITPIITKKAPKRFLLDFVDAYLVYSTSSNSIQIATEKMVLSYGSDWKKVKIKPFLYHLKQNFWKGFYWSVNTSRKEAYLMKGNNFGKIGDTGSKISNISVDLVGGSTTVAPTRFFLRFKKASLVYVPASKTLQIAAGDKVLSYGSDWKKCNLKPYLYQLQQNVWKGFHWQINTSRKLAQKVTGGQFCKIGGSKTNLRMGVRVVK